MQQFSSDGVRIAFLDAPARATDRGEPILLDPWLRLERSDQLGQSRAGSIR